jgi:hypothetical protein
MVGFWVLAITLCFIISRGRFKRKIKDPDRKVLALIPKVRAVFCLQHLADADTA